jgi:hypothetical protein
VSLPRGLFRHRLELWRFTAASPQQLAIFRYRPAASIVRTQRRRRANPTITIELHIFHFQMK